MPVGATVDNFDYGVSVAEIAEQFEVPLDRIEAIAAYAQSHQDRCKKEVSGPSW